MARNDDGNLDGRLNGEQPDADREGLLHRLFYMILIAILLSFASTVLTAITVIQFIVMLVSKGEPNERLADFGTDLGIWMAKAARYQAAASEVKPWPWSDLD
ncbi:DUF4389 domain-containing protein [Jannaschia sp. CCS1]|uniref:DUF4389 domain-containing protein n=1 Tax=Jannaschia sp. (strain CCS1) TaxID=290400 RepID=UPI000053CC98|nr:DUF4389 domain-containing protein [Jannaschia sp. CCS1]ABD56314.1 hypothetical protein Jann_3397 [Jannaschia sp. CCS1]